MRERLQRIMKSRRFAAIIAAVNAVFLNVLFSVTGLTEMSEVYSQVSENQYSVPYWQGVVLYALVAPVLEEMIFRGIIANILYKITCYIWSGTVGTACGSIHSAQSDDTGNAMYERLSILRRIPVMTPRRSDDRILVVPMWVTALVSAVLFGIYHGNMVQFLYASIMGIMFCVFYIVSCDFGIPLVMHSAANLTVYSLSMLF